MTFNFADFLCSVGVYIIYFADVFILKDLCSTSSFLGEGGDVGYYLCICVVHPHLPRKKGSCRILLDIMCY